MSRDYRLYLEDIQDATLKIENYVRDIAFAQFRQDKMRIDAVLHNLTIVGAAVKSIPPELRAKYSDVEWRKIQV